MESRKLIGRYDFIVMLAVIILAALFFVWNNSRTAEGAEAEITFDGIAVEKVSLSQDRQFSVPECPAVEFEVKDGAVRFLHSDCPDQICVKSGYLHLSGQAAACLPNKISLKIILPAEPGRNDFDEPDGIAK